MFTIDFNDHTGLVDNSWFEQIDKLLTFAKEQEGIDSEAELSVTFVDKEEIQKFLREEKRNKSKTQTNFVWVLWSLSFAKTRRVLQLSLIHI